MTTSATRLHDVMENHRGTDLPALTEELVRACETTQGLGDGLSIAEVAEVTGTTAYRLRYYERIGLVDVDRDVSGRRTYRSRRGHHPDSWHEAAYLSRAERRRAGRRAVFGRPRGPRRPGACR